MDISLARTFLAVVETGSFVAAAKRVHVTQSTVSMRIRSLEEQLGKPLFERGKAGASLTPAGIQFQRHASALVHIWQQARLEVSLPSGYRAAVAVGAQYSLWDGYLLKWLSWMRSAAPDVALRTQLGFSNALMERMIEGTLDVAVMYRPQSRPGFEVEMLFEEELVLVSSEPKPSQRPGRNYIYVDWGPEFQADHALNYTELSAPGLFMELGSLGLKFLLENPGSGYFPRRLILPHVEAGDLKLVSGAPVFSYPAYVVYGSVDDAGLLDIILAGLRELAVPNTKG